jgi:uncharacterized membrane protein
VLAALLALGAAVGWGTADFLAGRASRVATAASVLAISQAVGIVATGVAVAIAQPTRPSGELVLYAALSGLFLAIGLGSLYEGMRVGRISLVAPISATAAVVPVVYGIATGDQLTPLQAVGLGVAFVGVLLASTDRRGGRGFHVAAGVAFAVIAATAGGVNVVFLDAASPDGVLWTLVVQRLTVALLAGTFALTVGSGLRVSRPMVGPIVVIGLLDVLATGSFAAATTRGRLSVVSVIAALYPVCTVLLAQSLLHERLSRAQRVGVVGALAGVAVLVATRSA